VARLVDAHCDIALVGDSVGMVICMACPPPLA
jgi:ketopantoate hydroxymethyltransferase